MTKGTKRRWWTALDELALRVGQQEGRSPKALAQLLDRTPSAIREKRKRLGLSDRDRRTLSATEVARLLGFRSHAVVQTWVRRGWLAPIGGRRARPWRFADTAMWDLCANPQTWVAWRPERITDRALRAWALEQRAGQPAWLRSSEVARRFHVVPGTVTHWVGAGVFAPEQVQDYGALWLRADALDGFVPPCARPRRRIRRPQVRMLPDQGRCRTRERRAA